MQDHERERERDREEGDFAEGQEREDTQEAPRRFSEGQEELPHPPAQEHGGDFAEGQETSPHDEREGSFAEGQREGDEHGA